MPGDTTEKTLRLVFEGDTKSVEGSLKKYSGALSEADKKTQAHKASLERLGSAAKWAGLAIGAAMVYSIRLTQQFNRTLGEMAGLGIANINELKKTIGDLAVTYGYRINEMAAVTKQLAIMGVKGKDMPTYLDNIAKAARGSGMGMQEMAELLDMALDSFDMSAKDSTLVMNKLFAAMRHGEMTGQALGEILRYMARPAHDAGVEMDVLLSWIAQMSKEGRYTRDVISELRKRLELYTNTAKDASEQTKQLAEKTRQATEKITSIVNPIDETTAAFERVKAANPTFWMDQLYSRFDRIATKAGEWTFAFGNVATVMALLISTKGLGGLVSILKGLGPYIGIGGTIVIGVGMLATSLAFANKEYQKMIAPFEAGEKVLENYNKQLGELKSFLDKANVPLEQQEAIIQRAREAFRLSEEAFNEYVAATKKGLETLSDTGELTQAGMDALIKKTEELTGRTFPKMAEATQKLSVEQELAASRFRSAMTTVEDEIAALEKYIASVSERMKIAPIFDLPGLEQSLAAANARMEEAKKKLLVVQEGWRKAMAGMTTNTQENLGEMGVAWGDYTRDAADEMAKWTPEQRYALKQLMDVVTAEIPRIQSQEADMINRIVAETMKLWEPLKDHAARIFGAVKDQIAVDTELITGQIKRLLGELSKVSGGAWVAPRVSGGGGGGGGGGGSTSEMRGTPQNVNINMGGMHLQSTPLNAQALVADFMRHLRRGMLRGR